ncbi:MAG: dTDP-4-dehydrorhamnose 3,5-epimerase family protein [Pseudomonadota bacterium]
MSRFDIRPTPLEGLQILERRPISDPRGFFERMYCVDELSILLNNRTIRQVNRTLSKQPGTVRGMHFQHPPHAEMKFVSCLHGSVFDVAVDLRSGSNTFLKWFGIELNENNHLTLAIPEGYAHGFQTLTSDCELLYMHTNCYSSDAEGGVHPTDPRLSIDWPMPIETMSEKDRSHPFIDDNYKGIDL